LRKIKNGLAVLVSGGRSSAMMARHIQTSKKYDEFEKLYIFCNTGQEKKETIDFLRDMVKYWDLPLVLIEGVYSKKAGVGVKHKIVDSFDELDMDSKVFEQAIMQLNKHKWTGVPNQATPYCSEYLKTRPAHSFCKEVFGTTKYIKALGFRKEDMPKRITLMELEELKGKKIAPLLTDFEEPIGMIELNNFYQQEEFKLNLHSKLGNCELCWKKSEPNLIQAIQNGVRCIDWYEEMQEEYGDVFENREDAILSGVERILARHYKAKQDAEKFGKDSNYNEKYSKQIVKMLLERKKEITNPVAEQLTLF